MLLVVWTRSNNIGWLNCWVAQWTANTVLTHWDRDEMAAIFQTAFSSAFSWIKMYEFRLGFVVKGPINNIPLLIRVMAWHRTGDKPLPETMMVSLLTHLCVTRPQWVKLVHRPRAAAKHKYIVKCNCSTFSFSQNFDSSVIFYHYCYELTLMEVET